MWNILSHTYANSYIVFILSNFPLEFISVPTTSYKRIHRLKNYSLRLTIIVSLAFFFSQNNCHFTISMHHLLLFFSTIIPLFIDFHPTYILHKLQLVMVF